MFEGSQELEEQQGGMSKLWIGVIVVVAVVILLAGFRALRTGGAKEKAVATSAAAVAAATNADPVRDLKILRATMQKDSFGVTAVWSVTMENKSNTFTYTEISYQTDYIGANNNLLLENKGTIPVTIGPKSENSSEIRDTAYPEGTAWFKFKVTGAKAKVE